MPSLCGEGIHLRYDILFPHFNKKEELAEPNFCKLPYDTAPKAD
jgi:hypothetical protein